MSFSLLRNPHLLLTITALGWAGNAIAAKYALGHISPMVLTFTRWFLAFVIIGIIAHRTIWADRAILQQHWLYLMLMGGFGYAGFNALLYSAAKDTSAINIAILQTAMPLFIFVLNFILYHVAIRWQQIVGYLITLFGVLVTVTRGDLSALAETGLGNLNWGDILMLIAGLLYAGYSVGLRAKPELNFTSFLAALIFGGVVFSTFGLIYEVSIGEAIFPVTTQGMLVGLYTGVVPSLVSQGLFVLGVAALGANRAGVYFNLIPIFAAILAVLLLGDTLYIYHAIAFVLVTGGVMIAQRETAKSDA